MSAQVVDLAAYRAARAERRIPEGGGFAVAIALSLAFFWIPLGVAVTLLWL